MPKVTSADGTEIAYDRAGTGPALVLVGGALTSRAFGVNVALAKCLTDQFTVYSYDRRGRGDSGDTKPYSAQREIEDLEAVIDAAGGHVLLYGSSSGGMLALDAAAALPGKVEKLVVYEAPCVVDDTRPPVPDDAPAICTALLGQGKGGEVARRFLADYSQVPAPFVLIMRALPVWRKLAAAASTVPYDLTLMAGTQQGKPLPAGRWATIGCPALVIAGGKSPAWLKNAQLALRDAVPGLEHQILPGQTHVVKGKVLAPMLAQWLADVRAKA